MTVLGSQMLVSLMFKKLSPRMTTRIADIRIDPSVLARLTSVDDNREQQ